MANINKMHEFITNYFACKEGGLIERKSFERFKAAMPDTMDAETVKAAYTAYTGDAPYYNKGNGYPAYRLKEYEAKCHGIAAALTGDPTSFTDLYNTAFKRSYKYGAPGDSDIMRKCFVAAAYQGVIGHMEIRTCGKCHIRLYYAK